MKWNMYNTALECRSQPEDAAVILVNFEILLACSLKHVKATTRKGEGKSSDELTAVGDVRGGYVKL